MSLRVRGDALGAFVDAVYAIAVTILALVVPFVLLLGDEILGAAIRVRGTRST